ncbi:MAG: FtsQ-type POTRA domain-containing protein [Smithellaceae bacterium]|jgi:cell division protein FtsQ
MPKRLKTSYGAKRYRLRRRLTGVLGDFFRSTCLVFSIVALSFSFIYIYNCLLSAPYFEIKETSVRGLKELTEKDILALAQIKPAQNILAVNTGAVTRRVITNPWVKNIYVGRELPGRLVLAVQERTALALLKQTGDFYLVDNEGVVFKKLSKNDEVDLPILTGFDGEDKTKSKPFLNAINLLKTISNSRQYAYLGAISEIHMDEIYGLSLFTEKGFYLKLGVEGFESKLKQLKLVMADLEKRGMNKGSLCIDLCDESKITVQRKKTFVRTDQDKKSRHYRI